MKGWQQALLVMLIMIAALSEAAAGRHNSAGEHNKAGNSASGISEQRAIAIAQQHFRGRVLAINRTDNLYRIKILSDQGMVHTVLINAQNGAVVSTH
ncbi:Peptidase propeptide and YPEB domain-containing protein [Nitrosomonas eutropha]|uniref:Peptidase propeptide and YPEB domain-containing protein n=1 Tax=Nitrosomonas eutropha TaxID=916 RepID=A0A1I7F7K9_9PROT|nr:PepSY domain-containing protein [Nitrosomonas eutropha]SFU32130.1 Peptidase propeptide and YPEB domain-containing protein [Nitrosomonas eutropha]